MSTCRQNNTLILHPILCSYIPDVIEGDNDDDDADDKILCVEAMDGECEGMIRDE